MAGKRPRNAKGNFLKTFVLSLLGLGFGYFLLTEVSSWEQVPLGQVFYIIVGCIFIAVAGIFIFLSVKTRFFPKKRKKRSSKPVFLEDINKKKSKSQS